MPAKVATITQINAAARTATKKDAVKGVPSRNKAVLNAAIRPPDSQNDAPAPMAVVRAAQASARLGRAAPSPTRVATPLELSLAPLAKARSALRIRRVQII